MIVFIYFRFAILPLNFFLQEPQIFRGFPVRGFFLIFDLWFEILDAFFNLVHRSDFFCTFGAKFFCLTIFYLLVLFQRSIAIHFLSASKGLLRRESRLFSLLRLLSFHSSTDSLASINERIKTLQVSLWLLIAENSSSKLCVGLCQPDFFNILKC